MADKNEILDSLRTQPPYKITASTEDFIERLHRENLTENEFRIKFNDAVKNNLGFNVSISSRVHKKKIKK